MIRSMLLSALAAATLLACTPARDSDAPEPAADRASASPDAPAAPVPEEAPSAAAPLGGSQSAAPPADTAVVPPAGSASSASADWTAGVVERSRPGAPVATLSQVRIARNQGFDRVVFQFAEGRIPSYHVEYVDRPVRACGSGDVVEVAGDARLSVRLSPARAHDDQGRATIGERDRRLQLPVLRQAIITCDFEAEVEWVLGVGTPNRFRVTELRDPARLVVDVRH